MTLPLHLHPTAKHELNLSHSLRINDCLAVRCEFIHLEFIFGSKPPDQRCKGGTEIKYRDV